MMKACFENFIVDDTNRLAYEAATRFASESSNLPKIMNLSGVIGGGKTHLLQAIKYEIEMKSCRKVELVDGAHLIEQYIEILKRTQHAHQSTTYCLLAYRVKQTLDKLNS